MYLYQLLALLLLVCFSSCSSYQKLLKSNNYDEKYEKAKEFYNKEDFLRALPLFEELVNIYKGTDKAEKLYYYFAYCHYGMGDLTMATYHFKNFAETYSTSEFAEECQFMYAKCYKLTSPVPSLDQTSTRKAIEAFQLFINMYPESDKIVQCNEHIDNLRFKLEEKAFDNAKLYFKLGNYKASVVTLNNVLKDFPDIDHREEIKFLIVRSNYLYAENSIESKRRERYNETIQAYETFIDTYPVSNYLNDAESMYDNSLKYIQSNIN
ncbi:outer membrane protein assembly factor BamD [bacterium AH-315-C07]|nr:outer membrane protein assembly factor BamD [bacterium AH-315-C07]